MRVVKSLKQLSGIVRHAKRNRQLIGFVPTMGYLHQGHLSLVHKARKDTDLVVVSVFVNPIQFGPKEDFKRYPRDLLRDIKLAKAAGADIVFAPSHRDIFKEGYKTYIEVGELATRLCGRSRPGHFKGVATVVTKLFNIVDPDIAYFGQKDAQQAVIIKQMVKDLNMMLKIKVLPIVREKDGLAMSSRNAYLNALEREEAVVLYVALKLARALIKSGLKESMKLIKIMKKLIIKKPSVKIEYIKVVDLESLQSVKEINQRVLVALAVWFGKTRLIDNIVV